MTSNWLRAAGWWALDYNYVLYWQARGLFNRTSPTSLTSGELAPVLVIPGVYEPWQFLSPTIARLRELGHPVHVVPSLKLNSRPVPEAAALVNLYLAEHDLTGVVIFAHSKGGLIGKAVMVQSESEHRVKGMVAVATPFGGSVYARYMVAPSLRIFSPEDSTIRALAVEAVVNARIVSVYGPFDPHIPAGSELDGAKNVELETGGHFRVLANERILEELTTLAE